MVVVDVGQTDEADLAMVSGCAHDVLCDMVLLWIDFMIIYETSIFILNIVIPCRV